MSGGSGLRFDRFGPGEWLARRGLASGPEILFVPPIFEEMNRLRATIAIAMAMLGDRGFCCTLPDLPGTGESERPLQDVRWSDWMSMIGAVAPHAVMTVAIRGGTLLDHIPPTGVAWRLAPVTGASLIRDLERAAHAGGAPLGGYPAAPELVEAIRSAEPQPVSRLRTVRLDTDRGDAELKIRASAMWRRSEPAASHDVARIMADDITNWARACGIC